jgi:hypothetical protein
LKTVSGLTVSGLTVSGLTVSGLLELKTAVLIPIEHPLFRSVSPAAHPNPNSESVNSVLGRQNLTGRPHPAVVVLRDIGTCIIIIQK